MKTAKEFITWLREQVLDVPARVDYEIVVISADDALGDEIEEFRVDDDREEINIYVDKNEDAPEIVDIADDGEEIFEEDNDDDNLDDE